MDIFRNYTAVFRWHYEETRDEGKTWLTTEVMQIKKST
jgi:hypothetical protein